MYDYFHDQQIDVLKEVGNIGAGNAATALSRIVNRPISMAVPTARLISFADIADRLGGDETVVVAVFLRVSGDVPGNMFFILTKPAADALVNDVFGSRDTNDTFSELECSAISEIGNILSGSYLSSLSEFTSLTMIPSVPSLTIDMAGAVLGYGLLQTGTMGDRAVMIDTSFNEGTSNEIEAHFLLIPDPDALPSIFHALGVPIR